MEAGWRNSFSGGDGAGGAGGDDSRGQNSNFTSSAWDIWDISTPPTSTRYDWSNPAATPSARVPEASVVHALLFGPTNTTTLSDAGVGWNPIHHGMPDPDMMCLKLGKRHYCEDPVVPDRHVTAESPSGTKRSGKQTYPYYVSDATASGTTTTARWPGVRVTSSTRCQVEGCNVALGKAKEYYRRHKVCENHSKAPTVVVLGLLRRFCQQCSRFHDVTEFDEAKRSCRRRLEGHNLRRRKGTISNSLLPNIPHFNENNSTMKQRIGPLSAFPSSSESMPVCALSLLSSSKTQPWISSDDLSSRCSAALYELIVANRAASITGHFLNQDSSHQPVNDSSADTSNGTQIWDRFSHTTMTLHLTQGSALDFGLLSMKEKSKDPEEWSSDYYWSNGGANVV